MFRTISIIIVIAKNSRSVEMFLQNFRRFNVLTVTLKLQQKTNES